MRAIILAAGVGSRLHPITDEKPKCLVTVAGRSILQHQLDAYLSAGVSEVLVLTGHMQEQIHAFCEDYGDKRIRCISNDDYAVTNNMYSLYLALKECGEDGYLLSNGDCVYDPSIVADVMAAEGAWIATDKGSFDEESMKLEISGERICNISKTVKEETAYGNSIDLYKFDKAAASVFKASIISVIEGEKNLNEWTELAMQRMLQKQELCMYPFDIGNRSWVEIDNHEDLALADELFSGFDSAEIDHWFIDLDGTLYVGDEVIDGASEWIETLQKEGRSFSLLTNNSSKDKDEYVSKLASMGIHVDSSLIISSADGAVNFLVKSAFTSVFVLGTDSLRATVEEAGVSTKDNSEDKVDAVLLGYDTELTYAKLRTATELVNAGVPYYATHPDVNCPTPKGPIPDIGSMTAMLEQVTGVAPTQVFGKPSAEMVEHILTGNKLSADRLAFVGDRIYTDMKMARNVGAKFVLTLSGETERGEVEDIYSQPDLIVSSVKMLSDLLT